MATKTTKELINQLGNPMKRQPQFEAVWMVLWEVPADIRQNIPCMPAKIFLNRIIIEPLQNTLRALILRGLHTEFKTFDGCFNVRYVRGTENTTKVLSRHSWGLALDFNAAENPLNGKVTWSQAFLAVWRENRWTCGADWSTRPDGMHFEFNAFTIQDIKNLLHG